jgi:hypothetical protein
MAEGSQNGQRASGTSPAQVGDNLGPQVAEIANKVAATRDDAIGLAGAATDLAGAALEQGRALLGGAREQATGFADRQKDQAAQSVADLATSLRGTGDTFEGRPNIQAFVGSAADGLESLADSIRDRSFIELYGEAERFARERPVAVAAGALIAGFFVARFVKSSADGLAAAGKSAAARAPVRTPPTRTAAARPAGGGAVSGRAGV